MSWRNQIICANKNLVIFFINKISNIIYCRDFLKMNRKALAKRLFFCEQICQNWIKVFFVAMFIVRYLPIFSSMYSLRIFETRARHQTLLQSLKKKTESRPGLGMSQNSLPLQVFKYYMHIAYSFPDYDRTSNLRFFCTFQRLCYWSNFHEIKLAKFTPAEDSFQ